MDPTRANELFEVAERLAADARKLRDELEVEFITSQLAEVVAADYDLGEVVGVEQIFGGYVNLSFAVRTRDADGEHRYFVRKYNRAITEREIRFEHALVNHINAQGLPPRRAGLSRPSAARRSSRATRRRTASALTRFFAVYEMLEGEDKYTWVKNRCTDREFESGGRVLAQFHYLAHDFDPGGLGREQPPIMQFLRDLRPAFAGYAEQARAGGSVVDEYYLRMAARHRRGPAQGRRQEPELQGMPYIPVHCDYHPGNLKWVGRRAAAFRPVETSGSSCSGCSTSTGPSSTTASSTWPRASSTSAARGRAATAASCGSTRPPSSCAPTRTRRRSFARPGAMSAAELAALPRMIANANLYVLNWDVSAYYEADEALNDDEYLMYLKHQVMLMEFIEAHLRRARPPGRAAGACRRARGHGHDQERV